MIPRREMIGSTLLGGLAGLAGAAPAEAAVDQSGSDRAGFDEIKRSLDDIRSDLFAERTFLDISAVRQAQVAHLRTFGKFPDYIELGTDTWFRVYDWHIRWQQPLTLGKDPSGRFYTLTLLQTIVIMRTDQPQNYVGMPYDNLRDATDVR